MNYRREVDGLRAIAVLPVLLFHAGFRAFSGGFVGVDVFFVISGYLITTILISELAEGRFSIVTFYERRARRILPALFLVMSACAVVAWHWLLPGDMKLLSKSFVAVSVFASNILFWKESGYFDTAGELKPLLHTWSLAAEEQYYLLFPPLLMLAWRFARRWIPVFLGLSLLASLALAQWASAAKPVAAFFLLPTRGWELLVGSLVAFWMRGTGSSAPSRRARELGGWCGALLVVGPVFIYDKETPFPGVYALAPTLGAALILALATQQTTIGRLVGNRAFVGVGLISYSAYLWHQPLYAFARHRAMGEPGPWILGGLAGVSLVLASLSWRFVEGPFRDKRRISRAQIFRLSVSLSASFALLGYLGVTTDGFSSRFEKVMGGDVGHDEFHRYLDERYFDCEPEAVARQALRWEGHLRCKQSRKGSPTVVLLGDSHAEHLFLGLAEARPDLNVAFYIMSGSPYLTNPEFRGIFEELLGNGRAQHVILTMHFLARVAANPTEFEPGFEAAINALGAAGKTVSLLGDVPRFTEDPGYCVYLLPSSAPSASCSLPISDAEDQRRVYEPTLRRLSAAHGLQYVAIDAPLCGVSRCAMTNGASVLYRDNNHLNMTGSRLVGSYLAARLRL